MLKDYKKEKKLLNYVIDKARKVFLDVFGYEFKELKKSKDGKLRYFILNYHHFIFYHYLIYFNYVYSFKGSISTEERDRPQTQGEVCGPTARHRGAATTAAAEGTAAHHPRHNRSQQQRDRPRYTPSQRSTLYPLLHVSPSSPSQIPLTYDFLESFSAFNPPSTNLQFISSLPFFLLLFFHSLPLILALPSQCIPFLTRIH